MSTDPPQSSSPGSLEGIYATAEAIAARDLNNLYLTSCYFVDRERYRAFCSLYAVMRVVDDRIDDIPSRSELSREERLTEHRVVDAWRDALLGPTQEDSGPDAHLASLCPHPQAEDLLRAAHEAMAIFPCPTSLWENFFAAMHSDIERPRLQTFKEFLDYTEGASVAPTTIYLCLITASIDAESRAESPRYSLPEGFDLIACGRALGTFAYLGHILRDMAEDLATGEEGLVYLAAEDMRLHGVDEAMMRQDLARTEASPALRALVRDLGQRAAEFLATGRQLCLSLADKLQPDCAYILELIVTIYEEVLAKIASHGHDPMAEKHRLSMDEKLAIAAAVSERTGFSPKD